MKKYFLRVALILTLFSFYHSKTFSQNEYKEWIYVTSSSDGDKYYVNTKCVYDDNGYAIVWTKNYANIYKKNGRIYKNVEIKTLFKFDFKRDRSVLLEYVLYNSNNKVIESNNFYSLGDDWKYVVPNSILDGVFEVAKKLFNN